MFRRGEPPKQPTAEEMIIGMLDEIQTRDSMRMYNTLVERCFNECVNDFSKKKLGSKEELCVFRCTDKFIKHSNRVNQRFQEQSSELQTPLQTLQGQQPPAQPQQQQKDD